MEYKVNCPDSIHVPRVGKKDTKRKLYINPVKNKAHCFRCHFSTNNAEELCEQYRIEINHSFTVLDKEIAESTLRLPREYSTLFIGTEGKKAYRYLIDRGISPTDISGYNLGFCSSGVYKGRVVIPIYQNEVLVNFQARDYTGTAQKEGRYAGPSKADGVVPSVLFNLDRIAPNSVLVLTEGPLDALRLPKYAVGCIGSGWNSKKKDQVLSKHPQVVLMAFDRDGTVDEEVVKIKKDLEGVVRLVDDLPFTSKDLGSISEKELQRGRFICDALAVATATSAKKPRHTFHQQP